MKNFTPKNKKSKGRKYEFDDLVALVVLETGWDIDQVRKCPIPLFWSIVKEIFKRMEDESKSLK